MCEALLVTLAAWAIKKFTILYIVVMGKESRRIIVLDWWVSPELCFDEHSTSAYRSIHPLIFPSLIFLLLSFFSRLGMSVRDIMKSLPLMPPNIQRLNSTGQTHKVEWFHPTPISKHFHRRPKRMTFLSTREVEEVVKRYRLFHEDCMVSRT